MDQQFSSSNKDKLTSFDNSSLQRSSLQVTDRRTLSPIAFFRDGITTNDIELHNDFMGAQRRARAIATAPRRKRDDDDKEEDNEQKKTLLGFIKTSTVPLPFPIENQHRHSLPQIQSDTALIPTFRVDPPSQDVYG